METGIHALRMILGGVFDRYPSLQLILGHWGEMIPFYLARVNEALSPAAKHLQRPVADYFLQQVYVTPSGMFTLPHHDAAWIVLHEQLLEMAAYCSKLSGQQSPPQADLQAIGENFRRLAAVLETAIGDEPEGHYAGMPASTHLRK